MLLGYKGKEPTIGDQVYLAEQTIVIGRVVLKDRANIWFGTVLRGDVNEITVGVDSNIQDNSTIHVAHDFATIIGNRVTVGHQCIIHACTIEDDCLIGMGSTILDGATIGRGSIVGANSLVTMNKTFPPYSLIMGSPAKVVRPLTEAEIAGNVASAEHYVAYAKSYLEDQKLRQLHKN